MHGALFQSTLGVRAAAQAVRAELTKALLARWDPVGIERRVRDSQAERRFIKPYLFSYLNEELIL